MAKRFVAAGHEVHMITSLRTNDVKSKGWFEEKIDGINVHWLPLPYSNKMGFSERIKAFFSFAIAAGKKSVQIGGDVVFATSTPLTIALPGIFAAKRLKVPMVFEVRDLWPELPIAIGALKNPIAIKAARWLERFAYRHSDRIVALSPGMATGVVNSGYPEEKVSIIPNSCDIDLFSVSPDLGHSFLDEHPYLKGGPLVVYTGTLGVINGVGYFAEIAKEVFHRDPSIRFLIAGDGKEVDLVRKRASELGVLDKNFWMMPSLVKADVPALLSAATVASSLFVDLPEMWHNSANKFFDALAAGKPVMINCQGWQADIVREEGIGIVVPPNDPEMAANLLIDFINDKGRIKEASKAASRLARSRFARDKLAMLLLNVLRETVQGR